MWNKDQATSPSQPPAGAASARPVGSAAATASGGSSLVGETIRIQGTVTSKEDLQIHGELEGKLDLDSRLTIGPKGKVNAGIKANEVIIAGSVTGNVEAVDRITLRAGANLVGDVKTAGIVIEDGAYFKGGIDIARPGK